MGFRAKNGCEINNTIESQSDYKYHQWFQNGCNNNNINFDVNVDI